MINSLRTAFLLIILAGLFMLVGYAIGGTSGLVLALAFSFATNIFAYWNADKFVLRLQNAEPIAARRAPELFHLVGALAQNAGLPMPKLYLIHSDQPNAFATGRNPQNAAVAVSTGLLTHLSQDEVAAVIAHELAHIRNYDTLIMSIGATLAGAISVMAQFGLFFGGRNVNSPLGGIGTLLMAIFAPFMAMIVQMAVSRTREYEADAGGAEISGNPLALASALDKISQLTTQFENPFARRYPGMAHLYIVNPLAGSGRDSMFSTHPDVRNRIAALVKMAQEKGQDSVYRRDSAPSGNRSRRLVRRGGANSWRVPVMVDRDRDDHRRGPWG
jgi:heat shock protein HtpX